MIHRHSGLLVFGNRKIEKEPALVNEVTLKQLATLTEATLTGDETTVVTDVTHDSRRGEGKPLCAALRVGLFDALFVPNVMAQGAAGVL